MRRNKRTFLVMISALLMLYFLPHSVFASPFHPIPQEDRTNGRNSHVYLPSMNRPGLSEQEAFIKKITPYAQQAEETWGMPASAIIGMAILESGYGTTRTAVYANNIFGIKAWGYNPANAWQLVGQPDEDYERSIPVIANYGNDRIVYQESERRDNWYRQFASYQEAIHFLAGNLLINNRYKFARDNYVQRIKDGLGIEEASKRYLFEIGGAGYNHLGGEYYRQTVGKIIDQWNLYRYDSSYYLRDIRGHWAKNAILATVEKGWMNGHPDKTFEPNGSLTRAQAAKVLRTVLNLSLLNEPIRFHDVPNTYWAYTDIQKAAQHQVMIGTEIGLFSPGRSVTRAQMAQIFYNAGFYSNPVENRASSFSDVSNDHWAQTAIETMKNEGIITGYNGLFKPEQVVTRAELATMLTRISLEK